LSVQVARNEPVDYPTQKPVRLLERIVEVSSNPGDVVLDPMCGSGTALVAASRLGRKWIGIDKNNDACAIARKRCKSLTQESAEKTSVGDIRLKQNSV
jgi:site-specific DNA-methyltransferase (adenine-specific)